MSLVAVDPPCGFPFLRLPAELRLEIYRLLLAGRTIHIDGADRSDSQGGRGCRLFYRTCTQKPERMESLSHLNGASHSQDRSSATSHGTRAPCLSNASRYSFWCHDPVRLDVQLLRVCRQIYDEAALLPYAENYFITSHRLCNPFIKAFVTQFNLEKRSAMHTVAVLNNSEEDIGLVPTLLPELKRLWFDIETRTEYDADSTEPTLAEKKSKLVEAYSQVKFPSLIGVKVAYAWTWTNGDDKGMEERLELALLGTQSL